MSKTAITIVSFICLLGILLYVILGKVSQTPLLSLPSTPTTLWKYQCIDTMKTSRDRARTWKDNSNLHNEIDQELSRIKNLGANCVAIGTPYDDEFLSYLSLWIESARKKSLSIWFRGNFSSWEGWFSYQKDNNTSDQLRKTRTFILSHPELFADGDIFTPTTEAENGWNGGYVGPHDYQQYRDFLIAEYHTAHNAFQTIHKNVTVNWLSMSGGLARSVMDANTANALGHIVTIDHYVATPYGMSSYIDEFKNVLHSHVVIGEFGAPVPDINGDMTDKEQADFVDKIFDVLYQKKDTVVGVNYWVLVDGSTGLYTLDNKPKIVTGVIKQYFIPMHIQGSITDLFGNPLQDVPVTDGKITIKSDREGRYEFVAPAKSLALTVGDRKIHLTASASFAPSATTTSFDKNFVLTPKHPTLWYYLQAIIKKFTSN